MIFKKQLLYIKTEPKHDNTAPSFEFSRELVKYGWTPKWWHQQDSKYMTEIYRANYPQLSVCSKITRE